jgi:5-formyltetrahydrofolate cyclo-ligase
MNEIDRITEKKRMREFYLSERAGMDPEYRSRADKAVCAALSALSMVKDAECIAAYISDGTEVDLREFLDGCEDTDKKIFLPRYCPACEAGYELVEINDLSLDLVPGKYGLMEPVQSLPAATAGQIDNMLFLVPGVAFDDSGARLGRGKGIYDRLLSKTNSLSIGIFYDCQRAEEIPAGDHDQSLDMIVTEKVILNLKNQLGRND